MTDVFDPNRHRVVAVDGEGQHVHVTLGELAADIAALPAPAFVPGPSLNDAARELEAVFSKMRADYDDAAAMHMALDQRVSAIETALRFLAETVETKLRGGS